MGSASNIAIPVIDLQDFPGQSAKMIKACEDWGMFRIVNHEELLPVSLMLKMKTVIRSLMELPEEIKHQNTDVIINSGYFPPSDANPLYDALGLYDMASPDAVDAFCKKLNASPEQREIIVEYGQAVQQVIVNIGQKLGQALGLKDFSVDGWPALFRINRYRFTQETIGSSGLQIHTDTGFFTIVQDDDNHGGLEVMDLSGTFRSLDPWPGTFLVVIGDVGAAWSNGRLRNVKHRVVCKEPGIRVSIATFLLGPRDALVKIPEEFVDLEHPRKYVPFLYEDYRQLRISKKLQAGEALELIGVGAKNKLRSCC
ncbi:hypothetical protein ACH5RR_039362 [Cinchona calisaya]|uniref:2-oxoglutarate-dependent dioxygenase DAO n=1 Tax=Cinchona calisaya TaxID=153742 RepID=A0ABD2Y3G1_9GENT